MFERFTSAARTAVVRAQEEARGLRHSHIGPEHVLLGVLAEAHGFGAAILSAHGIRLDHLRDAVARRSSPGPDPDAGPDAEALRTIGIDLDAVRRKVEETFGPGALERRGRRRRHVPFTRDAKKALELALREALRLRHNYIGTEHLLLGLLRGGGLSAQLLSEHGIDRAVIEAHLHGQAESG
jgi:ATP-dependent Clp protease ATP-binding subunit ClpA